MAGNVFESTLFFNTWDLLMIIFKFHSTHSPTRDFVTISNQYNLTNNLCEKQSCCLSINGPREKLLCYHKDEKYIKQQCHIPERGIKLKLHNNEIPRIFFIYINPNYRKNAFNTYSFEN